ncbi:MAG: hypothetical protein RSB47_05130, partial [Ruthenibacterium sp.]
ADTTLSMESLASDSIIYIIYSVKKKPMVVVQIRLLLVQFQLNFQKNKKINEKTFACCPDKVDAGTFPTHNFQKNKKF